jgi:hypothetical protein
VLRADAFSLSNHSNNDNVRNDSHLRPRPACFCVTSLKVGVALHNKKTITVMMWLEFLSMEKDMTLPLIDTDLNIYYQAVKVKLSLYLMNKH